MDEIHIPPMHHDFQTVLPSAIEEHGVNVVSISRADLVSDSATFDDQHSPVLGQRGRHQRLQQPTRCPRVDELEAEDVHHCPAQ